MTATDRLLHHTKAFKNQPEAQVLAAIFQYLKVQGYFFWRQGNHGVRRTKNGKDFWTSPKHSMPGAPDIFLMLNNGFGCVVYGIEAKSTKGLQRPEQKEFQKQFEKIGGIYILARSVDDVIAAGF